jgi:hypothetical protein
MSTGLVHEDAQFLHLVEAHLMLPDQVEHRRDEA